jgi:tRNA (guanine-N7-)-methyltransferase
MRLKFLPSFVKRRGRITKKQKHSLRKLDNYSIKNLSEIISLSRAYECCTLEIGFGNSEYLQRQAIENPSTLFIGSEVYLSGIGTLIGAIEEKKLSNVRIFSDDARILLDQGSESIFDEVVILCPDPWPKDKHHKRRLINVGFLQMLNDFLKSNGSLYISTDWENYAESIKDTISRSEYFVSSDESYMNEKQLTKFEKRGIDQGRKIFEFNLKKKI